MVLKEVEIEEKEWEVFHPYPEGVEEVEDVDEVALLTLTWVEEVEEGMTVSMMEEGEDDRLILIFRGE